MRMSQNRKTAADTRLHYRTERAKLPVLAALALLSASSLANAQSIPADAQSTCTVTPAAFKTFFEGGNVVLNGVVNPANSVSFSNNPNCSFYQWSEQMFLWLTSPAPDAYVCEYPLVVPAPYSSLPFIWRNQLSGGDHRFLRIAA